MSGKYINNKDRNYNGGDKKWCTSTKVRPQDNKKTTLGAYTMKWEGAVVGWKKFVTLR